MGEDYPLVLEEVGIKGNPGSTGPIGPPGVSGRLEHTMFSLFFIMRHESSGLIGMVGKKGPQCVAGVPGILLATGKTLEESMNDIKKSSRYIISQYGKDSRS